MRPVPVFLGGVLLFAASLQAGDVRFHVQARTEPSCASTAVFAADMNGDGKLDLVGNLFTSFGNGDGTFQPCIVTTPTVKVVDAWALADVDGDGVPDLIATAPQPFRLLVFSGHRDGTFSPTPAETPLDYYPTTVTAIDLTGDGRPEVAMSKNDVTAGVAICVNQGGKLQPPKNWGAQSAGSHVGNFAFGFGDISGDGKPDLMVGFAANLSTYAGNGDGTFATQPQTTPVSVPASQFVDLNGDGIPDAVRAWGVLGIDNQVSFDVALVGRTSNSQVIHSGDVEARYRGATVFADVDGDHNVDAISLSGYGVFVWRGRGDGSFDPPRVFIGGLFQGPLSLVVGDFDGDGHPDIVTSATNNQQFFFKGKGDGSFDAPEAYCCGGVNGAPLAAAVGADLNHDGLTDIVAVARGGLDTYVNLGGGHFRREARTVVPFTAYAYLKLYVGDFDGDGIPDIALVEYNTPPEHSRMVVYFRDANGAFQWTPIMDLGTTLPIGVGTFHAHDSRAQVVFSHHADPFPLLPDHDRTALVTVPRSGLFDMDVFSRSVTSVVDADGDGLTDVVTLSSIGFNDGTARFTFVPSPLTPIGVSGAEGLAYGDVVDPVQGATTGPWRKQFRRIHRDRTFGEATLVGTNLRNFQPAGDFDGDGQPDLVCGNLVLLNRGNDTYVASELVEGYPIAFGDLDGDGLTDALVTDGELIVPLLNHPVPRGTQPVTLKFGVAQTPYNPTPPYYASQTYGGLAALDKDQNVPGAATIRSGDQVIAFYALTNSSSTQTDLRLPAGVTNLSVEFNGPIQYATASVTTPWAIQPLPVKMYANANGNYAGFPITLSTDLYSAPFNQPLPGPVTGTVDFIVNGKVEATLRPNGSHVQVTRSFAAGSYGIGFRYSGDPNELAGSTESGGVFTVVDPPVAFDKTTLTVVKTGATSYRISYALHDRDGNPLPPSLVHIGVVLKVSSGQLFAAGTDWIYNLPTGVTGALVTATVNDATIASTFIGTPQPHHRPAGK